MLSSSRKCTSGVFTSNGVLPLPTATVVYDSKHSRGAGCLFVGGLLVLVAIVGLLIAFAPSISQMLY